MKPEIMRNLGGLVVAVMFIAGCESSGGGFGWGRSAEVGDEAPDFFMQDQDKKGSERAFKSLIGDYTLIAFSPGIAGQGSAAPALQKIMADNSEYQLAILSAVDVHWKPQETDREGKCYITNQQGLLISVADETGGVRKLYGIKDGQWLLLLNHEREIIAREPLENAEKVSAMLKDKLATLSAQRMATIDS